MKNRNFSMIEYFNRKAAKMKPALVFENTGMPFDEWKETLRAQVLELMGPFPERVPLDAEIVAETDCGEYACAKVIYDVEEDFSITAYLLMPKYAPLEHVPAVIGLHGHGLYGAMPLTGIGKGQVETERETYGYNAMVELAKQGFAVLLPDSRVFGQLDQGLRGTASTSYPGKDKCNVHFIRGLILGEILLTLNLWDLKVAIDFLQTIEGVNGEKVGAIGLSWGGTRSTYISAFEERVKAAVISGFSVVTRNYAVGDANFCGSQLVPSLYKYADVADIQGLIAPKPLMIQSGLCDTCFNIEYAVENHATLKKIYEAAGASDNLEIVITPGEHEIDVPSAVDFFTRRLGLFTE